MAKSPILRPRTAQDIDGRIDRVLRGLGNPEPPLNLEQVRELLKLDRVFYTADDPTIVREVIARIRRLADRLTGCTASQGRPAPCQQPIEECSELVHRRVLEVMHRRRSELPMTSGAPRYSPLLRVVTG